jgi:adenosylcobinamide-phosphate guanylyltransferase
MGVTALIMAGGKATRMRIPYEKPLITICGKSMIQWVISALKSSRHVDDIVVATSKFTRRTRETMLMNSIRVVETSGRDYHFDMRYVISEYLSTSPVMVISADLPLITKEPIDEAITNFEQSEKQALMVAVRARAYEELGLKAECLMEIGEKRLVPVGVNIIDGRYIHESDIPQHVLVLSNAESVVNVNTLTDLKIAERLLKSKLYKTPVNFP